MISVLARIFIKNRENLSDGAVRRAYGVLCSAVGIALNIFLFALKYFAGTVSGSIAITADAFNNLSDAGSSIITLVGFKAASAEADDGHPFGHGRYEYISGFIVAIVILIMGLELGQSSIQKIMHPEPIEGGRLVIAILIVSVSVKLYMFFYNRRLSKRLSSPALGAAATDSISDCAATSTALIAALLSRFTSFNADGWGGALVALFIIYSGISAAKDTLSPLLGQAPPPELVSEIEHIITAHDEILGIHDLIVHDYGPGRRMISVHGEVSGSGNIYTLHESIDGIEKELKEKLGCEAVIHMDPIDTSDSRISLLRNELDELVKGISPELSIHDFRIVPGEKNTNLIFDLVLPHSFALAPAEVERRVKSEFSARHGEYTCVMNIEQSYC